MQRSVVQEEVINRITESNETVQETVFWKSHYGEWEVEGIHCQCTLVWKPTLRPLIRNILLESSQEFNISGIPFRALAPFFLSSDFFFLMCTSTLGILVNASISLILHFEAFQENCTSFSTSLRVLAGLCSGSTSEDNYRLDVVMLIFRVNLAELRVQNYQTISYGYICEGVFIGD